MSSFRHVLRTTLPHPDHFDASRFGADGRPVNRTRGPGRGRPSSIKLDQVEKILQLEKAVLAAERALRQHLIEIGLKTRDSQTHILSKLRGGWRPRE